MYSTERVDLILNYLKLNKRASIPELTKVLFVSEATVRRDLNEMQALGLITRTHGGALYAEESQEISIFVRKTKSAKEKVGSVKSFTRFSNCVYRRLFHLLCIGGKNELFA